MLKPRICVCTAPDAATAQTSLLMVVIAGATAVGGGDLTVVVLFDVLSDIFLFVLSDVLLEVLSVTIGSLVCAAEVAAITDKSATTTIFFIIFAPGCSVLLFRANEKKIICCDYAMPICGLALP
jgi:hypothetical protein